MGQSTDCEGRSETNQQQRQVTTTIQQNDLVVQRSTSMEEGDQHDLRAERQAMERFRRYMQRDERAAEPTPAERQGRLSSQGSAAKQVGELIDMETENDLSSSDGRTRESRFGGETQFEKEDRLSHQPDPTGIPWKYQDMKKTTSFRRDFSTAVDDYNTFREERQQT